MLSPAQTSTRRRNILIVVVIIVVLVVALLIVSYYQLNSKQVTKLSLNVSLNQTEVIQGNNLQAQVNVTTIGKAENVTLSSNSSSGINCTFQPSMGISNFTSKLTMDIPNSTVTGNYTVIVTASGNGQIENASFVVPVLSVNVTVSGRVILNSPFPTSYLYTIQFQDVQTTVNYTASFPSPYPFNADQNLYSITLQNEHTYKVTVSFSQGNDEIQFPDTWNAGNFYVYAPAGNTSVAGQNFTRPIGS